MEKAIFNDCRTLDEVKREYKRLALIVHNDRGGETEKMQELNRQYDEIMHNPFFGFWRANEKVREDFIKFPEIINQVIRFNVIIEVCGNWIWLSGDTFSYKEQLKKIGFFYSPQKKTWYWRPRNFKSTNKDPKDMDFIRSKYGSDVVQTHSIKTLQGKEAAK